MLDKLKGAWRSVTVWFNVIFGMIVTNFDAIRDNLPQLQPYLTPGLFGKLMVIGIVANILLRFKTNCDLAHK
jgi:hypothetical protein